MDEPFMIKNIVEELAGRRLARLNASDRMPDQVLVETSSIEAHVSGTVGLADPKDIAHMPFVTCFLFTCIKLGKSSSHLTWSSSLS
jgi:hypothetical protein